MSSRENPWRIDWVAGSGFTLYHCGKAVEVDILNGGPARCDVCCKEDSLEAAEAGALPLPDTEAAPSRERFMKVETAPGEYAALQATPQGRYTLTTSDGIESSAVELSLEQFRQLLALFPELRPAAPEEKP